MDAKQLKNIPLFDGLSKQELAAILDQSEQIEAESGRQLVTEGKLGVEFFVIVEGSAKVLHGQDHIADLGPGDFFGEMALLDDRTRKASVIATSPVRALLMTFRAFRSLEESMPGVAARIREARDERMRALDSAD